MYGPGNPRAPNSHPRNTSKLSHSLSFPVIVDSGSQSTTLPTDLATEIAAQYDPPSQTVNGEFLAKCNAVAPVVGVQFGNSTSPTMWFHPSDLILQSTNQTITGESWCRIGIQPTASASSVILV